MAKCSTRDRRVCTDNGAMIAYAGMVRFKAGATADLGACASALAAGGFRLRKNC
ncbi:hypothetical protein ACNKHN_17550 [Shigella flexneri]